MGPGCGHVDAGKQADHHLDEHRRQNQLKSRRKEEADILRDWPERDEALAKVTVSNLHEEAAELNDQRLVKPELLSDNRHLCRRGPQARCKPRRIDRHHVRDKEAKKHDPKDHEGAGCKPR